jgi:hypothetical protein
MEQITYRRMTDIANRVIKELNMVLRVSNQDVALSKLHQNVQLNALRILGKHIDPDKIDIYVRRLVQGYVEALPKRGEPVGILAAQSLIQPITQSLLKSQHRAGARTSGDDIDLIKLNSMKINPRIITLHLRTKESSPRKSGARQVTFRQRLDASSSVVTSAGDLDDREPLDDEVDEHMTTEDMGSSELLERATRWAKENEYCSFGEVLTTPYGNCKYIPSERGAKNKGTYVSRRAKHTMYINVAKTQETFYTFKIDPVKLDELDLTPHELFDRILTFECFGIVIHPLETFTFELCPYVDTKGRNVTDKIISNFNENVRKLMTVGIKGIEGVQSIDVKTIKITDVVKMSSYDPTTNATRLYVLPETILFFPLDELVKRIGRPAILNTSRSRRNRGYPSNTDEPLHLLVEGEYDVKRLDKVEPYHYIAVKGSDDTMTLNSVMRLEDFETLFRQEYIMSNDPLEMRELSGISVAQTIHEFNYYTSLKAKKFSLSYPHIQILCAKMFVGIGVRPITPSGFENIEGITPIDKLAYEHYTKHISIEPLRTEVKYPVRDLIPTTILGAKFKFGTNFARFAINEEARRRTIDLCSAAKTKQYYRTGFEGIDFYGVGQVRHVKSGLSPTLVFERGECMVFPF